MSVDTEQHLGDLRDSIVIKQLANTLGKLLSSPDSREPDRAQVIRNLAMSIKEKAAMIAGDFE